MKRRVLPAAVLALGLSAPAPGASPPIDPAQAFSQWRWIGLLPETATTCPQVPEAVDPGIPGEPTEATASLPPAKSALQPWTTRRLIPGSGGVLGRFCVYEYDVGEPVDPDAVARLQSLVPGQLLRVEQDRMAVAGSGVLGAQLWPGLEQLFYRQTGRLGAGGAAPWPALPPAGSVRLAVLDTHPTAERAPELITACSPHGYSLIHMARALLCDGPGPCLATITSRLALAYKDFDRDLRLADHRDEVNGGFVGLIGELAEAIGREVRAAQRNDPGSRLVLNVSAGWDPAFGGLEARVDDMPLAVQAVYRALEEASCQGAVVIAAAGNKSCGPQAPCGPLLPAAWEQRPAPSCAGAAGAARRLAGAKLVPLATPYRALVYAAGAVDGTGRAATTTLPAGMPPLQAYGDHAVVESHVPGEPTATLTGSSVAALVVSAAAAAAWAYQPTWDAHRLMSQVYASGEALDRRPQVCLGGPGRPPCSTERPQARRASLCAALAAACESCAPCAPWRPEVPQLPPLVLPPVARVLALGAPQPCPGETCGAPPGTTDAATPAAYCPPQPYHCRSRKPWLFPQPSTILCPHCSGGGGGSNLRSGGPHPGAKLLPPLPLPLSTVVLEIEDEHHAPALTLHDPVLRVCDVYYPVQLDGAPLRHGDLALIENVPLGSCRRVEILFTVDAGVQERSSAVSPLLIGSF